MHRPIHAGPRRRTRRALLAAPSRRAGRAALPAAAQAAAASPASAPRRGRGQHRATSATTTGGRGVARRRRLAARDQRARPRPRLLSDHVARGALHAAGELLPISSLSCADARQRPVRRSLAHRAGRRGVDGDDTYVGAAVPRLRPRSTSSVRRRRRPTSSTTSPARPRRGIDVARTSSAERRARPASTTTTSRSGRRA